MPGVVGITAEFNPFHRGHAYLIEQTVSELCPEAVVSVMSGDFVQRGEPACFDKRTRAVQAVKGGIDLVVELPAVFATSSAEDFARGAVTVLKGLGADTLAFGSESGSVDELKAASEALEFVRASRRDEIKSELAKGISYPSAVMNVVRCSYAELGDDIFTLPNNLLALQYIRYAGDMNAFTVARTDGYRASEMRERMRVDDALRAGMSKRYFDLIRFAVLHKSEEEIERTASAGEGLANRLISEVRKASSLEDLTDRVKSKRYTYTRISRMMIQLLLRITRPDIDEAACYIKPLAFNERGAALIRRIRNEGKSQLPFIDSTARSIKAGGALARTLSFDVSASDIYTLITRGDLYEKSDYVMKPVFVKE